MAFDRNKMMDNIRDMQASLEYVMEAAPCMVKLLKRFFDQAKDEGFTDKQAMEVAMYLYPNSSGDDNDEPETDVSENEDS